MVAQFTRPQLGKSNGSGKPVGWSQRSVQSHFRKFAWNPDVAEWLWMLLIEQAEAGNLQAIIAALAYAVGNSEAVAASASEVAETTGVPVSAVVESVLAAIRGGD